MTSPTGGDRRAGAGRGGAQGPRASGAWAALCCYLLSGFAIALGVALGGALLKPSGSSGFKFDYLGEVCLNWDGQWYKSIAVSGYSYDPSGQSSVAFFPAYPILAAALAAPGLDINLALLLASNGCYLAALLVCTRLDEDSGVNERAVLLLAFFPAGFFFRMAYSESTFLLATALFMLGMRRAWPLATLAAIVGLATAVRPVGVGLIPAFLCHAWSRGAGPRLLLVAPLSAWGLAAFMAYQVACFGDPLAFAKAHAGWASHAPATLAGRAWALVSLEPLLALFDSSSPNYWAYYDRVESPILSMHLAGALLFLPAASLIALGAARRWIPPCEAVAAASLLLIPYSTTGFSNYFMSMSRHISCILPLYFLLSRAFARMPASCFCGLIGAASATLCVYTALFCGWYRYY